MKHVKLFEQFIEEPSESAHLHTGKEFIDKMKIYADASKIPTSVSEITVSGDHYTFTIETDIPGFFSNNGKTSYKVFVPLSVVRKIPYVVTIEDGKEVLTTSLEISGENKMNILLYNYIEATNLYDDHFITMLVNRNKDVKTADDVKKFIKDMGTEGMQPDQ